MFENPTTIVLGAGASLQYGFPLATTMRSDILKGIGRLESHVQNNPMRGLPVLGENNASSFKHDTFVALASYLAHPRNRELLPPNFLWQDRPAESLIAFRDDLARETHDSVDRFIRDNPKHQFIGKALIGLCVLLKMYTPNDNCFSLRKFTDRNMGGRRSWYQQLVNQIREGARNSADLKRSRLSIVTFNYDLSLEFALAGLLGDTELHKGADYRGAVDIMHVNGMPADQPDRVFDVGKFLLTCGSGLRLVDEEVEANVNDVRSKACCALVASRRIYILGFHADDANVAAIGLRDVPDKGRVFCHNFNGHKGVTQRIHKLAVPEQNIMMGSVQAPVFIDEALDNGFLEQ